MDSIPPVQLTININQPDLKGFTMAEIDRIATAVANEVAEAITSAQARIDAALAQASASDEAREVVQTELNGLKSRATTLAENIEAGGLYGQESPTDPEAPVNPENPVDPEAPTDPEAPVEPVDPETPTDPGAVVF